MRLQCPIIGKTTAKPQHLEWGNPYHAVVNNQTARRYTLFSHRRQDCQALSLEHPPPVGCAFDVSCCSYVANYHTLTRLELENQL
jgi:hypothetical protein